MASRAFARRPRLAAPVLVLAALALSTTTAAPAAFGAGEPGTPAQARASQWWLDGLGVSKAHQVTRGEGVTVCVADTEFLPTAPDLIGADFSKGTDLTGSGLLTEPTPFSEDHGTQMAALIVGQGSGTNHAQGTLGVAPGAKVLWVSMSDTGELSLPAAIKACADLGADVITASVAGGIDTAAIAYAQARDAVIVAPTGNDSLRTGINDFAAHWGVIAVTGVDATLTFDPRANTSAATFPFQDLDPDPRPEDRAGTVLAAPYSAVRSTDQNCQGPLLPNVEGGYVSRCGTSGATAIVAGIVALVRSKFPELNAANVINRLIRTATQSGAAPRPSVPLGFGVVDAYAALSADVPAVTDNPLGSCYTGSRGIWDDRVKPSRPEPPAHTRLAPAPWKDPIANVPASTAVGPPQTTPAVPVTGPPDVASGPVAASGVSALVWIASGLAVVLGLAGVAAAVAVSRRGRRPTPSG